MVWCWRGQDSEPVLVSVVQKEMCESLLTVSLIWQRERDGHTGGRGPEQLRLFTRAGLVICFNE